MSGAPLLFILKVGTWLTVLVLVINYLSSYLYLLGNTSKIAAMLFFFLFFFPAAGEHLVDQEALLDVVRHFKASLICNN